MGWIGVLVALAAGLAEPQAESVGIPGVVVDAAGEPVAGAEIVVVRTGEWPHTEMLHRTESRADGRFEVRIPPATFNSCLRSGVQAFVAAPGFALAGARINPTMPPRMPLSLRLAEVKTTLFRVVDENGAPISGARVVPLVFFPADSLTVDLFEDRLAAISDHDGFVDLEVPGAETLYFVRIERAGYGEQTLVRERRESSGPDRTLLTLDRASTLKGRALDSEGSPAAGRLVIAESHLRSPSGSRRTSRSEATTDSDGRFALTLAAGVASVRIEPTADQPTGAVAREIEIDSRREPEPVEFQLLEAVHVVGRVVGKETGKPFARVQVSLHAGSQAQVLSGDDGSFEALLVPGPGSRSGAPEGPTFAAMIRAHDLPEGIAQKPVMYQGDAPLVAGEEFQIPDLEVEEAAPIRGRVIDESGQPLPGAWVKVRETEVEHAWPRNALTDAGGRFELRGYSAGTSVEVDVVCLDRRSLQPAPWSVGSEGDLELRATLEDTVALTGRVVDTASKPVSGVEVKLWHRYEYEQSGNLLTRQMFEYVRGFEIRTAADGTFRIPRRVESSHEYSVEIAAPGLRPQRTGWQRFAGQSAEFDPIVLVPLGTCVGTVQSVDGTPAPSVRVFQSLAALEHSVLSGEDGRFRITTRTDQCSFVFAESAGGAVQGTPWTPGEDVELILGGEVEAPLTSLDPALDRDARLKLAIRVLTEQLPRFVDETDDLRTLEVVALVDPLEVQARLARGAVEDPWQRDYLRRAVAKSLMADSLEESLAVVESMEAPRWRATGYMDAFDLRDDLDPERRLELLGEVALHARAMDQPSHRILKLAAIAERLLDLGMRDEARELLEEGLVVAEALNTVEWEGYARGAFAEELCQVDLDKALELIEDLSDSRAFDRHHGNIAHELAGRNPADAERVLGMMRQPFQKSQWAARICYRMATVDVERAGRIAAQVENPYQRAWCQGVMVLALAEAGDTDYARDLLREAYDGLRKIAESGENVSNAWTSAAVVGGALLRCAEAVDPALVRPYLWETLALRPPLDTASQAEAFRSLGRDLALALLVSRYERDIARRLIDPFTADLDTTLQGDLDEVRSLFTALAHLDPHRALRLLERDHATDPRTRQALGICARDLAAQLTREGGAAYDVALSRAASLWVPDKED